jgi:hypothetical protein
VQSIAKILSTSRHYAPAHLFCALAIALFGLLLLPNPAEARRHHHHYRVQQAAPLPFFSLFAAPAQPQRRVHRARWHTSHHVARRHPRPPLRAARHHQGTIQPHPAGCPHRAFCGCGLAVHLFGTPVRSLWLAAEWPRRFPRAAPAPGMVAARRHHVMGLLRHISANVWLVYDANSGGHLTRIHARSIAGYTIVNPRH